MPEAKKVSPRVLEHVENLRAAGLDTAAFFQALVGIRDDSALKKEHREALYKLIASECFIWYMEALRGEPVDRVKLAMEAQQVAEQNEVAIKKRTPGDSAMELVTRDIVSKGPQIPPDAHAAVGSLTADGPTVVERRPTKKKRASKKKRPSGAVTEANRPAKKKKKAPKKK